LFTEDFENNFVGLMILNVRAFAGEVEREKITERTMRGKLERVRSEKLPQIEGVPPNAEIGRRETDPFQAGHCDHVEVALDNEYK
jgi:DNA invertase Pin-like site-specific DNA recombinase